MLTNSIVTFQCIVLTWISTLSPKLGTSPAPGHCVKLTRKGDLWSQYINKLLKISVKVRYKIWQTGEERLSNSYHPFRSSPMRHPSLLFLSVATISLKKQKSVYDHLFWIHLSSWSDNTPAGWMPATAGWRIRSSTRHLSLSLNSMIFTLMCLTRISVSSSARNDLKSKFSCTSQPTNIIVFSLPKL